MGDVVAIPLGWRRFWDTVKDEVLSILFTEAASPPDEIEWVLRDIEWRAKALWEACGGEGAVLPFSDLKTAQTMQDTITAAYACGLCHMLRLEVELYRALATVPVWTGRAYDRRHRR